ncbi:MAG: hypothetical protein JWM81_242 [Candidatus Saccharibacteria bacterium]|nr:hypothetical protein [Candidatus Saccharibacteria bacterium]
MQLPIPSPEVVRDAELYLADRQGQPIAVMETWHLQGRAVRTFGFVGVLDDGDNCLGGIKLQRPVHELSVSLLQGSPRITLCNELPDVSVIPLADDRLPLTLGVPRQVTPYTVTQDVLAGEDITPWITECFQDQIDQYVVFFGIGKALRARPAARYLMQQPFVGMLEAEQSTLLDMAVTLIDTEVTIAQHERAIEDAKKAAAERLAHLQQTAGQLAFRIPQSANCEQQTMPAAITDRRDIQGRLRALHQQLAMLTEIIETPKSY